MVKLFCASNGLGGVFAVRLNDGDQVDEFKNAIKAEKANNLKDVDADKLQHFLTKSHGVCYVKKPKEKIKTPLLKALTKKTWVDFIALPQKCRHSKKCLLTRQRG
ncbi:hypothetical protein KXD40_008898 [Peronospora effusa]|uniref:Crinkler effector protein N-terminal domain-containing protein n=1 Tax=Peronospora effusa TaxID=542832 RepID=A0A3M6VL25_9STRA|nr:hypothetical protein DD238_005474 [Peronospora effusa]RQM12403.1 hypothetical protein DD237_000992 [Peronospora effusa]UIZ22008.1 hypothetical protein KXD40_008898 [Peronospora effusa]